MALPTDVKIFEEPLGPYDTVEYMIDASPLLEKFENIASYTVTLPTESSLLGLQIVTTGGYSTSIANNVITFWLAVNPVNQADLIFVGAGVTVPIEVSIITTSVPARKRKRTIAVNVAVR